MLEDLRYLSQKYPNWNYFFVHGKGYNFKQLLSEVDKDWFSLYESTNRSNYQWIKFK